MDSAPVVRTSLVLPHPIAAVWRAWSDPAWLTGWQVERVEGELAPGAAVRFHYDSLGLSLDLEVAERADPERLVLRGAPPGRPPQTQSVTLTARGGATEVTVEHAGFTAGTRGADERAGTEAGWSTMLRVLGHYLDRHAGRPRACLAALAPAAASIESAWSLLGTGDGLARWLCDGPVALAGEGAPAALTTRDGLELTGSVLAAAAPYEVALALDRVAGVVILRAIRIDGGGGALLIGAQAWSWRPELPAWQALGEELEPAVARLVDALGGARGGLA
ncbi:MAG TPA: SRPBCC domain-containing protein [Kofleriaceae bacterium]|nr:SRPBCC domain-containing protein [Kofleriaceae bacterium]